MSAHVERGEVGAHAAGSAIRANSMVPAWHDTLTLRGAPYGASMRRHELWHEGLLLLLLLLLMQLVLVSVSVIWGRHVQGTCCTGLHGRLKLLQHGSLVSGWEGRRRECLRAELCNSGHGGKVGSSFW